MGGVTLILSRLKVVSLGSRRAAVQPRRRGHLACQSPRRVVGLTALCVTLTVAAAACGSDSADVESSANGASTDSSAGSTATPSSNPSAGLPVDTAELNCSKDELFQIYAPHEPPDAAFSSEPTSPMAAFERFQSRRVSGNPAGDKMATGLKAQERATKKATPNGPVAIVESRDSDDRVRVLTAVSSRSVKSESETTPVRKWMVTATVACATAAPSPW